MASDFVRSLNANLDTLSRGASDRARDEEAPPKPQPQKLLRGEPGSVERMRQVAAMSGDPSLLAELGWAQVGTALENALHQIRADEARDDFWDSEQPAYRPETVEAFSQATRLIATTRSPELYAAFQNELGEDSPLQEFLDPAIEFASTQNRIEDYGLAKAAEEQRMGEREQMLSREYADIERRTGRAGITAADQLAENLHQEGVLYDPHSNEDHIRAELRATAEQQSAGERAMRQGAFLTEFDREAARRYGPGSSWNDQEREKWETELRNGTVEVVNRTFGDPQDAADRAILGMIADDQRHATGKSALERGLDAEIAKQYEHSRQGSPHLNALREESVKEYERTHDESGYPTTDTDGLGREHRRRG